MMRNASLFITLFFFAMAVPRDRMLSWVRQAQTEVENMECRSEIQDTAARVVALRTREILEGDLPFSETAFVTEIPVFAVCMDPTDPERGAALPKNFEGFSPHVTVVLGVNGSSAESLQKALFEPLADILGDDSIETLGRLMGATLGHLRAISAAHESGSDMAIIVEDDVSPYMVPFWTSSLESLVEKLPRGWKALQLHHTTKERCLHPLLPFRQSTHHGATAYLLHRQGMELLLKEFARGEGRFSLMNMRRHCPLMTADDCLMGFSPVRGRRNWLRKDESRPTTVLGPLVFRALPMLFVPSLRWSTIEKANARRERHRSRFCEDANQIFRNCDTVQNLHFESSPLIPRILRVVNVPGDGYNVQDRVNKWRALNDRKWTFSIVTDTPNRAFALIGSMDATSGATEMVVRIFELLVHGGLTASVRRQPTQLSDNVIHSKISEKADLMIMSAPACSPLLVVWWDELNSRWDTDAGNSKVLTIPHIREALEHVQNNQVW